MKKIQDNFLKIFICLCMVMGVSCDEGGNPDAGATGVVAMSGDWFVQTFVDGELVLDYSRISTFNTAADDGTQMWVDDHGNIWPFKVKCPVNTTALTFSGNALENELDDVTVTITNGTIVKDGAVTTGGNMADEISFEAEFSDDPGTIYSMVGYKRNGLLEDEH